jgi:hypothetical protein
MDKSEMVKKAVVYQETLEDSAVRAVARLMNLPLLVVQGIVKFDKDDVIQQNEIAAAVRVNVQAALAGAQEERERCIRLVQKESLLNARKLANARGLSSYLSDRENFNRSILRANVVTADKIAERIKGEE